ncbi:MAG: PEGA domain-containing protein [Polyangiaceae bacterium]|nr:PEGA domain-containing protein [Polyangiaceae bacterium]
MKTLLSRLVTTAAFALTMSFAPCDAVATEPSVSAPQQPEAQKLLELGVKALQSKQWEKAQRNLLEAWRIEKHYRIAANLGLVEIERGQFRSAAEYLVYCLRNESDMPESHKVAIRGLFEKASARIGTLDVRTDAMGATILVDGEVVGHTPIATIFVEPGKRTVTARMAGKAFVAQHVEIAAGEEQKVVILEEAPRPSPSPLQFEEEPSNWSMAAVPLGGLALAGFGVGVGCTVAMGEHGISAESRDNRQVGAVIGYGVGSAALLATMIVALWPSAPQKQKTGLFVAPVVGGGQGGVQVVGAF